MKKLISILMVLVVLFMHTPTKIVHGDIYNDWLQSLHADGEGLVSPLHPHYGVIDFEPHIVGTAAFMIISGLLIGAGMVFNSHYDLERAVMNFYINNIQGDVAPYWFAFMMHYALPNTAPHVSGIVVNGIEQGIINSAFNAVRNTFSRDVSLSGIAGGYVVQQPTITGLQRGNNTFTTSGFGDITIGCCQCYVRRSPVFINGIEHRAFVFQVTRASQRTRDDLVALYIQGLELVNIGGNLGLRAITNWPGQVSGVSTVSFSISYSSSASSPTIPVNTPGFTAALNPSNAITGASAHFDWLQNLADLGGGYVSIVVPSNPADLVGRGAETVVVPGVVAGNPAIPGYPAHPVNPGNPAIPDIDVELGRISVILQNILDAIRAIPVSISNILPPPRASLEDWYGYLPEVEERTFIFDFRFLLDLMPDLSNRFPFSVPFSIYNTFRVLAGELPVEMVGLSQLEINALMDTYHYSHLEYRSIGIVRPPVFTVEMPPPFNYTFVLDLADYQGFISLVRWSILASFAIGMMKFSMKFI